MKSNPVIIISGPTATRKTHTAVQLALAFQKVMARKAEILNFDSLLFYNDLHIGTARPSMVEQGGIRHHLMGVVDLHEEFTAGRFVEMANPLIEKLLKEKIIPILVGGSGFYLRALIKGMYPATPVSPDIKKRVSDLYQAEGITPFIDLLKKEDPDSFHHLHGNDHYRIMRAVEHLWTEGQPISQSRKRTESEGPYDFLQNAHPEWNLLHLYLDIPKDEHNRIISERVEKMLASGLIEEVKHLLAAGYSGREKGLQSIGYKEVLAYLRGELGNVRQLSDLIATNTRHLAKAQRTFFKKINDKIQYNPILEEEKLLLSAIRFVRE